MFDRLLGKLRDRKNSKNQKADISSDAPAEARADAYLKTDTEQETKEEYELVEKEIAPARIICPDCGGITLEGLEFCDKCGGELQ